MRRPYALYSVAAIMLAVLAFFAVNLIARSLFSSATLDLTENSLYTLTDGTRAILTDLDEPITLRLFYSEEQAGGLVEVQAYAARVKSLLKHYDDLAGDELTLEFITPEPFSDAEDDAVAFGMQAVPVNTAGDKLYFGLAATNSTDDLEAIPFLQPNREAFLEYDLTRIIYALANPQKPTIGLLSWLPLKNGTPAFLGGSGAPWVIYQQLTQQFAIEDLDTSLGEIPEDIDVLMVVHPQDVSDDTQLAIDQFVLRGGRLLLFVDPMSEASSAGLGGQSGPKHSELNRLLQAWGVTMQPGKIAADRTNAITVNAGPATSSRLQAVDYVTWMELGSPFINQDDVVTAELNQLRVISSGILTHDTKNTTQWTPLITTSDDAMTLESFQLQVTQDPAALLRNYVPDGHALTLAGRISGPAYTAFPEREGDTHIMKSEGDINVIVIADTDLLDNRFWVRQQAFLGNQLTIPTADNGALAINAVENLTGNSDLISLRSRGTSARPFVVVDELRRKAEDRFREEEVALRTKLRGVEEQFTELQQRKEGDGVMLLSPQQQAALGEFRETMVATRKQLREVQHALREEIDRLGGWLAFLNIAIMPLGVLVLAVFLPRWLGLRRTH